MGNWVSTQLGRYWGKYLVTEVTDIPDEEKPAQGGLLVEAELAGLAVRVACHVVPPRQFALA